MGLGRRLFALTTVIVTLLESTNTYNAHAFHQSCQLQRPRHRRQSLTLNGEPPVTDPSRRFVLMTTPCWLGTTLLVSSSQPALAKYGESSSMEFPNYIDFLMEKNNQGLVDTAKLLYKGADPLVLLQRLQDAKNRLQEIPALVEQKKWSQIQGVLTGPLGTMAQTINFIATPDSKAAIKDAAKNLKAELYVIGQTAAAKKGDACIDSTEKATTYLDMFVKVAFE